MVTKGRPLQGQHLVENRLHLAGRGRVQQVHRRPLVQFSRGVEQAMTHGGVGPDKAAVPVQKKNPGPGIVQDAAQSLFPGKPVFLVGAGFV